MRHRHGMEQPHFWGLSFNLRGWRAGWRPEAGVGLLEVIVTSAVVGIAAAGIALMFSFGNTWVVAKGDDRVALGLAQQKIEQLRSLGFNCIALGGPPAAGSGAKAVVAFPGCTATQNYKEGGTSDPWVAAAVPAPAPAGSTAPPPDRRFIRLTCVEHVSNTNFSTPAYDGKATGIPCNNPPGGNPVTNAKRITVIVQPSQQLQADEPVILQAWISDVAGGI